MVDGFAEERQGEDFDEEEAEKLQIENEKEEEVLGELAELLGKLAKYHKAAVLRSFSETIFPVALSMMVSPLSLSHACKYVRVISLLTRDGGGAMRSIQKSPLTTSKSDFAS